MPIATLDAIRQKVRRITRKPSINQLSQTQLDEYINTFIVYDIPQRLKLFNLRRTLTFTTTPNIDTYSTNETDRNDPLYDFKNRVTVVHPQIYVGGYLSTYTEKRDLFYQYFPPLKAQPNSNVTTTTAIGAGPYSGTVTGSPINQKSFTISALTTNNVAMTLVDVPQNPTTGILAASRENPISATNPPLGSINYLTGAWTVTFPNVPIAGNKIQISYLYYAVGRPWSVLFFDNTFTLRPIPDRVYTVEMQVDVRPTELIAANELPELSQWWQYIAWGASMKVFEDQFDFPSIDKMRPMLEEQEMLVQSSTIQTQINERTSTIYSNGSPFGNNWFYTQNWPY